MGGTSQPSVAQCQTGQKQCRNDEDGFRRRTSNTGAIGNLDHGGFCAFWSAAWNASSQVCPTPITQKTSAICLPTLKQAAALVEMAHQQHDALIPVGQRDERIAVENGQLAQRQAARPKPGDLPRAQFADRAQVGRRVGGGWGGPTLLRLPIKLSSPSVLKRKWILFPRP